MLKYIALIALATSLLTYQVRCEDNIDTQPPLSLLRQDEQEEDKTLVSRPVQDIPFQDTDTVDPLPPKTDDSALPPVSDNTKLGYITNDGNNNTNGEDIPPIDNNTDSNNDQLPEMEVNEPTHIIDLEQIRKDYNDTVEKVIPSTASRFLSHIQTDKVVYRPGDMMFVQAYIFDALEKTPAYSSQFQTYLQQPLSYQRSFPRNYGEQYVFLTMTVINPTGEAIYSTGAQMFNSTVSFTYLIPEDAVGGEYQVRTTGSEIPESIRVFRIRQYERQELNIQAQFNASSYKPGDFVSGQIVITPADGSKFLNGQYPSYSVVVTFENGTQFTQQLQQTDESGLGLIEFQIPEDYSLGYLSVQVTAFYRQIIQGYTQTLTIVQVQDVYIEFFPETFNYVYDVENWVYFQAYSSNDTENAEYVDIQGAYLVFETGITYDEEGNPMSAIGIEVTDISTYHEGRGVFSFIPRKGMSYYLEFYQGDVSNRQYLNVDQQPDIDNLEINFGIDYKVIEAFENLNVYIQTNEVLDERNLYVVGVFNKEQIVYLEEFRFKPSTTSLLSIDYNNMDVKNGGVLRLAVFQVINALVWYDRYDFNAKNISTRNLLPNPFFDVYFIPRGELLFFKKPAEKLYVDINKVPNKVYQPGEFVEFDVQVDLASTMTPVGYDRRNPTVRSFISVTVSDESVNYQLENRKLPPSLPAMVYLEKEIKTIDNQFLNSEDYIDYIYQQQVDDMIFTDGDQPSDVGTQNAPGINQSDINTDLLLGVQGWRYGYFYPQVLEQWPELVSQMNASESRQLQNLMAYTFNRYVYYNVRSSATPVMQFARSDAMGGAISENVMFAAPTTPPPSNGGQVGLGEAQSQDQNEGELGSAGLARRELEFWNFLKKYTYCDFQQNTRLYQHAQGFSFFNEEASRFDTTETVFYQAAAMTDREGKYRVRFYLSDLITSFRVTATAFDTLGRMGYARSLIISRSNFYISFQLPQQITIGDSLLIPVYINNNFNSSINAQLEINTFDRNLTAVFEGSQNANSEIIVGAENQQVVYIRVNASSLTDQAYIQIRAVTSDPNTNERVVDSIFRDTVVVSPGVQQSQSQSGLIGPNQAVNFIVDLPETMVPSTQNLIAEVYPSSIDALVRSLINIITGTPGPCFICIFNPLYADLLVLRASQNANFDYVDASNIQKQAQNLNSQISTYVRPDGSAVQFSGGSQDPFLSILYLLYSGSASQILGTDNSNQVSIANYLLGLRSAEGTYSDLRILYQPYPDYIVEAFLVYALTSVGFADQLQTEIARLQGILDSQMNQRDADTLFIGLMANIYVNVKNTEQAERLLDFLASKQLQDGSIQQIIRIDTAPDRVAYNQFDATAAAVLGWQSNSEKYGRNIAYGVNYIIENLRDRYYGSSIGVILSFNALLNYLRDIKDINGSGEFVLSVNQNEIDRQYFGSDEQRVIQFQTQEVNNLDSKFQPGSQVEIELQVENYISDSEEESGQPIDISTDNFSTLYYLEVSYDDTNPQSSLVSDISLTVEQNFNASTLGSSDTQGQLFSYQVTLRNLQAESSAGLIILEFRPASCLQINFAQLETLKLNKVINEYQATDNNSLIQIYIEGLDPSQSLTFQLDFLQSFQGECRERPIDAYEYYNPNQKSWVIFE